MQQVTEGPALARQEERLTRTPVLPVVVGPTASGKTDLALALAARLGGTVVSADMGQLYRGFDAGTAKPPRGSGVLLVDVLDPTEPSDAGSYARLAEAAVRDLRSRGRVPVVAGGTGLYIKALVEGLDDLPRRDPDLRARLEARAADEGPAALHEELARRDPEAARRVDPRNRARVVRALEIVLLSGGPASRLLTGRSRPPLHRALYLGLDRSPADLRARIKARAEGMFPAMLEEVRGLLASGLTGSEPGFRCLGYPEALAVVRGECSAAAGLERMVFATNAYARRQRTWFKGQTRTRWLDPADAPAEAERLVREAS